MAKAQIVIGANSGGETPLKKTDLANVSISGGATGVNITLPSDLTRIEKVHVYMSDNQYHTFTGFLDDEDTAYITNWNLNYPAYGIAELAPTTLRLNYPINTTFYYTIWYR